MFPKRRTVHIIPSSTDRFYVLQLVNIKNPQYVYRFLRKLNLRSCSRPIFFFITSFKGLKKRPGLTHSLPFVSENENRGKTSDNSPPLSLTTAITTLLTKRRASGLQTLSLYSGLAKTHTGLAPVQTAKDSVWRSLLDKVGPERSVVVAAAASAAAAAAAAAVVVVSG